MLGVMKDSQVTLKLRMSALFREAKWMTESKLPVRPLIFVWRKYGIAAVTSGVDICAVTVLEWMSLAQLWTAWKGQKPTFNSGNIGSIEHRIFPVLLEKRHVVSYVTHFSVFILKSAFWHAVLNTDREPSGIFFFFSLPYILFKKQKVTFAVFAILNVRCW